MMEMIIVKIKRKIVVKEIIQKIETIYAVVEKIIFHILRSTHILNKSMMVFHPLELFILLQMAKEEKEDLKYCAILF